MIPIKVNECVCCIGTSPSILDHLFEVPQRSTAVLAGYCKAAERCCRTWGHQHLSLSPVSPKYLKSTDTQTSGRSLHTPAPRLPNVLRSVLVAVAEHHLTAATGWNKKTQPRLSWGSWSAATLFCYFSTFQHCGTKISTLCWLFMMEI